MQLLTKRQQMILDYIRRSIRDRGYPPTLREIGAQMGIRSTNGVSDHLRALERKGHLKREDMKSRALRPVSLGTTNDSSSSKTSPNASKDVSKNTPGRTPGRALGPPLGSAANTVTHEVAMDHLGLVNVPLVGRVAAGLLSEAVENIEQQIMMDPTLIKGGGETFALRVRGESMIEAGIHDGDILFVRRQPTANKGEIVVALVGDEATVKRYFPERGQVRLQPENQKMLPIIVPRRDLSSFRILGIAVGLFRTVTSHRMV